MSTLYFNENAMPVRGRWKASLPGGLAIFCAVAWVTAPRGVGGDETLSTALTVFKVGIPVFGVLWWLIRKRLQIPLVVSPGLVQLQGRPELRAPLRYQQGWFPERLESGIVSGTVAVLWLRVEGQNGSLMFRKAL